MKGTKEFYDIQKQFEEYVESSQCTVYFGCEIVRSPKDSKCRFYENGKLDDAFKIYMAGYMAGRLEYM